MRARPCSTHGGTDGSCTAGQTFKALAGLDEALAAHLAAHLAV